MSHYKDVKKFHEKFGLIIGDHPQQLTHRKLQERVEFMQEELNEFIEGMAEKNLAKQADALVDLVYVALGTAVMLGLPWKELWDDVQRANMSKVRGITHRGHSVDVCKPKGWEPPKTWEILRGNGYSQWELEVDDPEHLQEKPEKTEVKKMSETKIFINRFHRAGVNPEHLQECEAKETDAEDFLRAAAPRIDPFRSSDPKIDPFSCPKKDFGLLGGDES